MTTDYVHSGPISTTEYHQYQGLRRRFAISPVLRDGHG